MLSIDNSEILDYAAPQNTLDASVAFAYAGATKYTSAPTIAITGGGAGSGATATAIIDANGFVTGATITDPGSSYDAVPTVAFSGGSGSGATGTATYDADTGEVTGIVMTATGSGKVTVTDNTIYASDDSREVVNVSVFDEFGKQGDAQIGESPNNVVVDLGLHGLNEVDGLNMIATVLSKNGKVKDGSVHGVGTGKTSGNFVMEK